MISLVDLTFSVYLICSYRYVYINWRPLILIVSLVGMFYCFIFVTLQLLLKVVSYQYVPKEMQPIQTSFSTVNNSSTKLFIYNVILFYFFSNKIYITFFFIFLNLINISTLIVGTSYYIRYGWCVLQKISLKI